MKPGERNTVLLDMYNTDSIIESVDALAHIKRLAERVQGLILADHDELVLSNTLEGCEYAAERYIDASFARVGEGKTEYYLSKPYDEFTKKGTDIAMRIVWARYTAADSPKMQAWEVSDSVFLLAIAERDDRYILPLHVKVGWASDAEGRFGAFKIVENQSYSDIRNQYKAVPLADNEQAALVDELAKLVPTA